MLYHWHFYFYSCVSRVINILCVLISSDYKYFMRIDFQRLLPVRCHVVGRESRVSHVGEPRAKPFRTVPVRLQWPAVQKGKFHCLQATIFNTKT